MSDEFRFHSVSESMYQPSPERDLADGAGGNALEDSVPCSTEFLVHVVDFALEPVTTCRISCTDPAVAEISITIGSIKKAVSTAKLCALRF